jgi:hypothetical protein
MLQAIQVLTSCCAVFGDEGEAWEWTLSDSRLQLGVSLWKFGICHDAPIDDLESQRNGKCLKCSLVVTMEGMVVMISNYHGGVKLSPVANHFGPKCFVSENHVHDRGNSGQWLETW